MGTAKNDISRGGGIHKNAGTIIAAVAVVVVFVAAFGLSHAVTMVNGDERLIALVHDGDGAEHRLPLDTDAEYAVTTSYGTNVVVVEAGSVHVSDADCDNHDCIKQGSISSPGQQVICLPHRLWIEIVGEGQAGESLDVTAVPGASGSTDSYDTSTR